MSCEYTNVDFSQKDCYIEHLVTPIDQEIASLLVWRIRDFPFSAFTHLELIACESNRLEDVRESFSIEVLELPMDSENPRY
jgi:hypothetical protein